MTTYFGNGRTVRDDDSIRQLVGRILQQAGYRGDGDVSQLYLRIQDNGPPAHDIKRSPEDPGARALHRIASEVCDPELIREYLVDFGITMQAVGETAFGEIVDWIVDGITRTRAGAIIGPAQNAAGEQQKIVATTENDVAAVVADRHADGLKADRLEDAKRPRLVEKIANGENEVAQLTEERKGAERQLAEARERYQRGSVDEKPKLPRLLLMKPPGDLMARIMVPIWMAVAAIVLDVGNGIVNLEPPISNVINTSQVGCYLIAIGVSVVLGLASALAGFALAAIRLPGRVAGALFVLAFLAMMVELVTGLDELRLSESIGAETLTLATVASCYVSVITGYALAVWLDFRPQRDVLQAIIAAETQTAVATVGSELVDAVKVLARIEDDLTFAKEQLCAFRAELDALDEEVESLRDSAARADVEAHRRESQGIIADVETAKIIAIANTQVEQEVGATKIWGRAMGWASWRKTRAEELPKGNDVRAPVTPGTPTPFAAEEGLTALQKAAIASLLIGALALVIGALTSLVVGSVVMAAAAAIAAVLLMIEAGPRRPRANAGPLTGDPAAPVPIVSPADESSDEYREQPSSMVPKYRRGDPTTGERL